MLFDESEPIPVQLLSASVAEWRAGARAGVLNFPAPEKLSGLSALAVPSAILDGLPERAQVVFHYAWKAS
jgi:hypothetical protein